MRLTRLTRLAPDPARCLLFCLVRNEAYYVPHFLDHYRRLGIAQFVFVDDRSDDGTRETLLRQDDCLVVDCDRRWDEELGDGVRVHHYLKRVLPGQLVGDGWVLTVDADEFLVLPPGFATIDAVTADLERRGEACIPAALVDFYPATLRERNFDPSLSPFDGSPLFDRGPLFDWRPGRTGPFPTTTGIRPRLAAMLAAEHPEEFQALYGGTFVPATSWKVPLLRWGRGIVPLDSHSVSAVPYLAMQAALAHFKLCPGIDAKIARAIASRSYARASLEYRLLARAIARFETRPLAGFPTATWSGPRSMAAAFFAFAPADGIEAGPRGGATAG
ncbi:MAG: glycosyltransferase family 2 protein [Alphaproteobacteria bacterium]|nr:glycosyltransferase family 2 protein [Alphaproteobacteria bacterium]